MLCDDATAFAGLRRIVGRFTVDFYCAEELLQVAHVHLWNAENKWPGQTASWYLQSCKFHLQNYLAAGRSVDSRKHQRELAGGLIDSEEEEGWAPRSVDSVFEEVSVADVLALLKNRLSPPGRVILNFMAAGLGSREIARELRVSHQAVMKQRRKIARLALKLGISPPARGRTAVQFRDNNYSGYRFSKKFVCKEQDAPAVCVNSETTT